MQRVQLLRIPIVAVLVLALGLMALGMPTKLAAQTGSRGQIELTIVSFAPVNREAMRAAVGEYTKKNPNVSVRFLGSMGQATPESLLEQSDIAVVSLSYAASLAESGSIRDLGSMRLPAINRGFEHLIDDLTMHNGSRYWIPIDVTPTTLQYDANAWRNYPIPLPPLDWSLQDFEQTLRQLKARGYESNISLSAISEIIVHSYGGKLYDPDTETWRLDEPATRQGLAHVARLVHEGLIGSGGPGMGGSMDGFQLIPGLGVRAVMGQIRRHPLPRGPVARATPITARVASSPGPPRTRKPPSRSCGSC